MSDTPTSEKIQLSMVRLSFADLFQKKKFSTDDAGKFKASFLMDPTDKAHAKLIKQLDKEIDALCKIAWPKSKTVRPTGCLVCLRDGDEKDYDGYEGMMYLAASESARPLVINRDGSPLAEEDGVVYAGCWVDANITLWAMDNEWGKRINANLRSVRFRKDDEAFGRKPIDAEGEFDPLEDEEDEEDFLGDD